MVYVPPKYPGQIPTLEDLPNRQDDVDWLVAARYNELKKELRACLTELGTLPKGEYADVKTRLDAAAVGDKIIEGDSSVEVIDTNGDGHVDIKTENVLCGKYHSDGIHDLAKQSRCRVYRTTSVQSVPTNTPTKVELNGETFDNQNEYDPVTNFRFTAKKEGSYLVVAQIGWSSAADQAFLQQLIYKNGVPVSVAAFKASGTGPQFLPVHNIIYLAVNDFIELWGVQESGGAVDVRADEKYTYMGIHKLS